MDDLLDFFKRDQFAQHCGIRLLEVGPGYAKACMTVAPTHWNAIDTTQGGAIFTLADLAFAAASNSHRTVAVAINASISFLKAVSAGVLTAEARETSINPRLATYRVDVRDEAGDVVALFQGMVYRKKDPLPGLEGSAATGG